MKWIRETETMNAWEHPRSISLTLSHTVQRSLPPFVINKSGDSHGWEERKIKNYQWNYVRIK